jgi:hypothetical protein
MDHQPAPADRAALIRRIESARARFTAGVDDLRGDLDVGARMQHALTGRPLRLIGIAAGAGLLFGLLRGRGASRGKKRHGAAEAAAPYAKAALVPVLLKFLFPLIKPALAAWIAQRVARSRQ